MQINMKPTLVCLLSFQLVGCSSQLNLCVKMDHAEVEKVEYKLCDQTYALEKNQDGLWENLNKIKSCESTGDLIITRPSGTVHYKTGYVVMTDSSEFLDLGALENPSSQAIAFKDEYLQASFFKLEECKAEVFEK